MKVFTIQWYFQVIGSDEGTYEGMNEIYKTKEEALHEAEKIDKLHNLDVSDGVKNDIRKAFDDIIDGMNIGSLKHMIKHRSEYNKVFNEINKRLGLDFPYAKIMNIINFDNIYGKAEIVPLTFSEKEDYKF